MLETDDIDDDFFTPVPSTSLANIFGEPSKKEPANESLKYTPPKKQVSQEKCMQSPLKTKANEELKVNECMFACAVTAYEWIDNNYVPRGKLGFAILKIARTNSYNIVLYSSNKTNLSSTTITTELNINLKGKNYISYYDINNKYWSVYGTEEDMNKITEILQILGVDVKNTSIPDHNPPEQIKSSSEQISEVLHDKESDTDSSVNRRTKASILNRMANMGHSVLPSNTLVDRSSESSESNETQNQLPKIRPKPTKNSTKKSSIDKKSSEPDITDCIKIDGMKMPLSKIEQSLSTSQAINPTLFTIINGQLIPVSNPNNMMPICGNNEMNLFMTEQRVNNNELRVNINRTTDKVDQVLEKLKFIDQPNVSTNLQIEVMQKLLTEYENKIKNYEHILASNKNSGEQSSDILERAERETYEVKILNLQSTIEEKSKEIVTHENFKKQLLIEINRLKQDLTLKSDELEELSKELNENKRVNENNDNQAFETRLKEVINDVYHSISINFDSDESYSGDNVMKIIASVIKKTTIQSLSK